MSQRRRISWVAPSQTTDHLRPDTSYSILVNPSDWAGVQGAFWITAKTLP